MHFSSLFPASMLRLICFVVGVLVSFTAADTEIRNFQVHDGPKHSTSRSPNVVRELLTIQSHARVATLNATHNELSFAVRPAPLGTPLQAVCESHLNARDALLSEEGCLNELWLELVFDASEWMRFDSFTIRLSWPAFYPTDFDIALFSPEELSEYIQSRHEPTHPNSNEPEVFSSLEYAPSSRIKYARIRLVDTGVRAGSKSKSDPSSVSSNLASQMGMQTESGVPFTVILEPLLFGVLPASLIPTIKFLVPLLVGAGLAFPFVMRYLEGVAAEARRELYGREQAKRQ